MYSSPTSLSHHKSPFDGVGLVGGFDETVTLAPPDPPPPPPLPAVVPIPLFAITHCALLAS